MDRVCSVCKKEKPLNEFNQAGEKYGKKLYTYTCKVCMAKNNRVIRYDDVFTEEKVEILLDSILNHKINYINDLITLLDTTLENICAFMLMIKLKNYNKKVKCICQSCNKDFFINPYRVLEGKNKFCSTKCRQLSSRKRIKFNCEYCNKEVEVKLSLYNRSNNHFCSHKCADAFRKERLNIIKICEFCSKEFITTISSKLRFCSNKCQGKWQSKYLIGERANNYKHQYSKENRKKNCWWCNKEFYVSPSKISNERHFCSYECKEEWWSKEFITSNESRHRQREVALKNLETNKFKTDTGIQIIINDILDNYNIKYTNEYNCKYVSIDNYLDDNKLMIEVMGTYWHCDFRFYNTINYEMQVNRIKNDKIKHSYIKTEYAIEILYLWEYDILNNRDLCEKLLLKYIKNKGILENYHSFNYEFINNQLKLKTKTLKPYMEYDIKELNKYIDIKTKEKMSKKQIDKWITYKCDNCGKPKEQLISHYKNNKNHFCSHECTRTYKRKTK